MATDQDLQPSEDVEGHRLALNVNETVVEDEPEAVEDPTHLVREEVVPCPDAS